MQDANTYTIEIRGQVRPEDLAMLCPPGYRVLQAAPEGLAFTVATDQSGLIGLLRHLHSRGIVFEAVRRGLTPSLKGRGRG